MSTGIRVLQRGGVLQGRQRRTQRSMQDAQSWPNIREILSIQMRQRQVPFGRDNLQRSGRMRRRFGRETLQRLQ